MDSYKNPQPQQSLLLYSNTGLEDMENLGEHLHAKKYLLSIVTTSSVQYWQKNRTMYKQPHRKEASDVYLKPHIVDLHTRKEKIVPKYQSWLPLTICKTPGVLRNRAQTSWYKCFEQTLVYKKPLVKVLDN